MENSSAPHGLRALMQRMLGQRWLDALILVSLLALGYSAYKNVASGFMP